MVTSGSDSIEIINRMENKIDKLTLEITKCYDVITLLFNTIMSSNNASVSSNITTNITSNTDNESNISTVE